MAKIYITYRANDTTQDELPIIVEQLKQVFGRDNVTISEADANADIFALYKLVQEHDALLVLIGQRFTTFVDDYGRPLLDNVYDYLYNEMLAALEKDEMWISTLLTDDAKMPSLEYFPENLREIVRRDSVSLHNLSTVYKDIEALGKRLSIIRKEGKNTLVKVVQIPVSEVKQEANEFEEDLVKILIVFMLIFGLCASIAYLYDFCFRFVNVMTC